MSNLTAEMGSVGFYNHNHLCTILILGFTTLAGVPGNALVLWVIGVKMKWTMTTIWFWNLALADIICCLSLPFTVVQFFYSVWLYGPVLCRILHFIVPLNMFASVFTLVTISIDRCILVVIPIWARNHRTVKKAWLICLAIWMLSFMMCIPKIMYQTFDNSGNQPCCRQEEHDTKPTTYAHMVFGFLFPFLIICACYISIGLKLRNSRHVESGKKITKVALGVIVVFFITWAPFHIMGVILQFTKHDVLDLLSQALAQFNSCINPILYVLMRKVIRERVRRPIVELMQNTFSENTPPSNEDTRTTSESVSLQ